MAIVHAALTKSSALGAHQCFPGHQSNTVARVLQAKGRIGASAVFVKLWSDGRQIIVLGHRSIQSRALDGCYQ